LNLRRLSKWMMMGTETAAIPANMMELRKDIISAVFLSKYAYGSSGNYS